MEKLIGAEIKSLQNLISRQLDSFTNSIGDLALSGPNLFILKYLQENKDKDIFQRDIEKVLSVTKSTCSKVLSTMESKKLIKRNAVRDARLNKITITPLGDEMVEKFNAYIYAHDKSLVEGLTEEQVNTLLYCLDTIKANILKKM